MIVTDVSLGFLMRLVAPLSFRSTARVREKLLGFSATEAGSALDMLAAAERVDDPELRRLFFRHAMDEARHAQMFKQAALALPADCVTEAREHEQTHALCQGLYEPLGTARFVAFVHLAESRALAQFNALAEHFASDDAYHDVAALFRRVARDERFHVGYSKRILDRWRAEGRGKAVRNALMAVRFQVAWQAWRNVGRVMADRVTRLLVATLYFAVLPPFALLERTFGRANPKLCEPRVPPNAVTNARRQH